MCVRSPFKPTKHLAHYIRVKLRQTLLIVASVAPIVASTRPTAAVSKCGGRLHTAVGSMCKTAHTHRTVHGMHFLLGSGLYLCQWSGGTIKPDILQDGPFSSTDLRTSIPTNQRLPRTAVHLCINTFHQHHLHGAACVIVWSERGRRHARCSSCPFLHAHEPPNTAVVASTSSHHLRLRPTLAVTSSKTETSTSYNTKLLSIQEHDAHHTTKHRDESRVKPTTTNSLASLARSGETMYSKM